MFELSETVVTVLISENDELVPRRAGPSPFDSVWYCIVSSMGELLRLK